MADPVKAKVHKNLNRYAEDSLDARIRQVQNNADLPLDFGYSQNYNSLNMKNQRRQGDGINVVFNQPGARPTTGEQYNQPQ